MSQKIIVFESFFKKMMSAVTGNKEEDFKPRYTPVRDRAPLKATTGSAEGDVDMYAKSSFTALEHAQSVGHHPKLWAAVKGSPHEVAYIREVLGGDRSKAE